MKHAFQEKRVFHEKKIKQNFPRKIDFTRRTYEILH